MPAPRPYRSTHSICQIEPTMKEDQRYNSLPNLDEHSDSSTEVGDWDTQEDGKPWRRRPFWTRMLALRWLLDTALLLIIVALLAEKRWKHHNTSHAFELAGDLTGFAPKFSQEIRTFKPDMVFAPENASEFWSSETTQAWLDIVPGIVPPGTL